MVTLLEINLILFIFPINKVIRIVELSINKWLIILIIVFHPALHFFIYIRCFIFVTIIKNQIISFISFLFLFNFLNLFLKEVIFQHAHFDRSQGAVLWKQRRCKQRWQVMLKTQISNITIRLQFQGMINQILQLYPFHNRFQYGPYQLFKLIRYRLTINILFLIKIITTLFPINFITLTFTGKNLKIKLYLSRWIYLNLVIKWKSGK